ncbi:hypothetical protein [Brevundimonas sp. PAMC22021]|uniref:hypothetical protein n=1 Tax=Brevundimonas sp. PAMC22021 TaxID=2861285 RepID=UPI001C635976|nr:hypothetical protein [Brevundimonas sp. PAMC22021]QYF86956.1 hypothetical protein KY493_00020 [Brevundimonas sp. PAMC22021]
MQAKFDRLLLSLVRFVKLRIDGDGARFPYLRRVVEGSPPGEVELQHDLWEFLTTSEYPEAERKQVSAGRVDIWIPQGPFRFVIEVKRLLGQWVEPTLQPLLRQTTAYQQTDVRLGVLAILDLSDRPSGIPHFDQCFEVRDRSGHGGDVRTALILRVPGNRRTPSDHAVPGGGS